MRLVWALVALLVLLPAATAQAAPPTCSSVAITAEDDGRPTRGSVGCRGGLVPMRLELVTAPQHGTLAGFEDRTFPLGDASALVQYTPTAGYLGADGFTVRATAAGESVTHVVEITVVPAVDDPPQCHTSWTNEPSGPGPVALDAGELAHGHIQCGDDEGAPLAITLLEAPAHGTLSALKPLGVFPGVSFSLRPDAAHRGADRFTLRTSDGTHLVDTVLTVDVVEPTNDAPMCSPPIWFEKIRPDGRYEVTAGVPVELTWACGDPEGAALEYSLAKAPAHGTVTLDAPGGFAVRSTYVAAAAHTGEDEFTVRIEDGPHVLEHTFRLFVVAPPVMDPEPTPEPPVVETPRVDPRADTGKPAMVVVGPSVKPVSSLDRRIAKACGKLKGSRKATCAKRERALARCSSLKSRTKSQKAKKQACVRKAKLIGTTKKR